MGSLLRTATKPSTAHCTIDLYVRYLLAQTPGSGCCELSEILKTVSHDSINRFLYRDRYVPKDLFNELVSQDWLDLVYSQPQWAQKRPDGFFK